MLCDPLTLAVVAGPKKVVYAYGCERNEKIVEAGELRIAKSKRIPKKARNTPNLSVHKSRAALLERFWRIWSRRRQSTQHCLAFSPFCSVADLFASCVQRDLEKRRFHGPNPILDVGRLCALTSIAEWKTSHNVEGSLTLYWSLKKTLNTVPRSIILKTRTVIFFDAEAWGFYGEKPFAIAASVYKGEEHIENQILTSPPEEALTEAIIEKDRIWVEKHVLPYHPKITTCSTSAELVALFGKFVASYHCQSEDLWLVAERAYPLERQVCRLIDYSGNLIDVCAIRKVMNETFHRPEKMVKHDPIQDVYWSALQYVWLDKKMRSLTTEDVETTEIEMFC